MAKSLYDPEYWKERAAKTRLRAEETAGGDFYVSLLKQAEEYDRLASEATQYGPILPLHRIEQRDPDPATFGSSNPSAKRRFGWLFLRLRRRI
jgi:hypothetical protein